MLVLFWSCFVLLLISSRGLPSQKKNSRNSLALLAKRPGQEFKTVAVNRQAKNEYEFEEKLEAGLMLTGSEVKSCRKLGQVQINEGFVEIRDGEAWCEGVHIAEHTRTGAFDQHLPKRTRKLLLHQKEILKLEQRW